MIDRIFVDVELDAHKLFSGAMNSLHFRQACQGVEVGTQDPGLFLGGADCDILGRDRLRVVCELLPLDKVESKFGRAQKKKQERATAANASFERRVPSVDETDGWTA